MKLLETIIVNPVLNKQLQKLFNSHELIVFLLCAIVMNDSVKLASFIHVKPSSQVKATAFIRGC
ncbi:MAG: hypothetical protein ACQJCO_08775 [cyanobacterium endosymbiont of Rhopalodia sterrenbergii]